MTKNPALAGFFMRLLGLTRMFEKLEYRFVQFVHIGFSGWRDEDGVIASYGAEDPFGLAQRVQQPGD